MKTLTIVDDRTRSIYERWKALGGENNRFAASAVAKELGMHDDTVRAHVRAVIGVRRKAHRASKPRHNTVVLSQDDISRLVSLRFAGLSYDEIARRFGKLSNGQVKRVIQKHAPELTGSQCNKGRNSHHQSPLTEADHRRWIRENCVLNPRDPCLREVYGGSSLGGV